VVVVHSFLFVFVQVVESYKSLEEQDNCMNLALLVQANNHSYHVVDYEQV
jgi:hypothetical protein